jgi:hypothetical protein
VRYYGGGGAATLSEECRATPMLWHTHHRVKQGQVRPLVGREGERRIESWDVDTGPQELGGREEEVKPAKGSAVL